MRLALFVQCHRAVVGHGAKPGRGELGGREGMLRGESGLSRASLVIAMRRQVAGFRLVRRVDRARGGIEREGGLAVRRRLLLLSALAPSGWWWYGRLARRG